MTAQILAAELGNLIQDSKRKNTELRTAAEKSLQDLKSLPHTSEVQLSADISRRPQFISPFLIACNTRNAKFAATGVSCLQRLGVSRALPKERLAEVLESFKESVSSSHDVQLKILQVLPSLVQNYPSEVRGDSLSTVLQICSELQNAKNFAVSNTAAATLQQLVIAGFDRVASEDERSLEIPIVTEVKGDNGLVPVRPAANDAYKLFNDLVLLAVGEKPLYMRLAPIPSASILELIEAVLSNHETVMTSHMEQVYIVRTLLMPLILKSLSGRLTFPMAVRIVRILNLMIRYYLDILSSECEIALGLLNHMLDPEASQLWKRALCLEVFRSIYADPRLLLSIYRQYDATEGKKAIFGDNLASFVRLAVEKPTLIGLGQQSTAPMRFEDGKNIGSEQAVAEAGAIAGVIGGPSADANASKPLGISSQWSLLKTPCIEQLDKSEPPSLPDTYVYSLVLTCITNISESLAKFVLPLTVHHEDKVRRRRTQESTGPDAEAASFGPNDRRLSRTQSFHKKSIPVNPLDLTDHAAYPYIETSSNLVMECWPAVLATCSTFLNATLDTDYYRALVRAIQKFTQVSGLLRLATPRDAFLTTLGKAAVPSSHMLASVSSPKPITAEKTGIFSNAKGLLSVDSLASQSSSMSVDKHRRPSHDTTSVPALNARNLLCLRALLNLAIALGPTLESAWRIIFETLQIADLIMALSSQTGRTANTLNLQSIVEDATEKMEAETSAVQAAARRLFESTMDFPNDAFTDILQALCALLTPAHLPGSDETTPTTASRPPILHQRRMGSVSGMSLNTEANSRDSAFALNKLGELAALNEARLTQYDPAESGWDILITHLVKFSADDRNAAPTRLLAADVLSRTVREIADLAVDDEQREDVQIRVLLALQTQISGLYSNKLSDRHASHETDTRVHQIALEALKGVIEQCGDSLTTGWSTVFGSLMSVFLVDTKDLMSDPEHNDPKVRGQPHGSRVTDVISKTLARSAFATVQLVCSDFMSAVPDTCLSNLLELLHSFCCQNRDLNMSLTAITFAWNVSDYLQQRNDLSVLPEVIPADHNLQDVRSVLVAHSDEGMLPALWLRLLLDLASITEDERAEVRNSATQTIRRIFESYADQLSSPVWMLCLRVVLFGMIEANAAVQLDVRSIPQESDVLSSWDETTKTVLQTVGSLFTAYMDRLGPTELGAAWTELLGYLQQYFDGNSHALGVFVFETITEVLSRVDNPALLGTDPILKTAGVWNSYFDHREMWTASEAGNQEAFVAYADAFRSVYQLAGRSLDAQLPSMLINLEACINSSEVVVYSSDTDHMTPLQTKFMECLSMIKTEDGALPSCLIRLLSRIIVLPYAAVGDSTTRRGPTFVALAKHAMALLQAIVGRHVDEGIILSDGAYLTALQSLARPVHEKFSWQREGKAPTLWQKATSTAIAILEPAVPTLNDHHETIPCFKDLWATIISLSNDVARAQFTSKTGIPPSSGTDEALDIEALKRLRDMITLSLGSPTVSDALRRTYTRDLFSVSIIHTPLPGELPDLTSAPLDGLYKIRYGQTAELETTWRIEMSYTCMFELFSLVAARDGSPARVKLAQAASPYLILRAALPLKTYIADQPIRGRMPMPEAQRRELLFVLKELESLKSESLAIPDAPGVRSKHRKHLHRLYPLLNKASRVARRDAEISGHIVRLMEMVGEEFGLEDD